MGVFNKPETFEFLWETAEPIVYQEEWANNTGYFDGIAKVGINALVRFEDDHGRRVVVVPLRNDVIVINERYAKKDVLVMCQYWRKDENGDPL